MYGSYLLGIRFVIAKLMARWKSRERQLFPRVSADLTIGAVLLGCVAVSVDVTVIGIIPGQTSDTAL